jgi:hypothetical protein
MLFFDDCNWTDHVSAVARSVPNLFQTRHDRTRQDQARQYKDKDKDQDRYVCNDGGAMNHVQLNEV